MKKRLFAVLIVVALILVLGIFSAVSNNNNRTVNNTTKTESNESNTYNPSSTSYSHSCEVCSKSGTHSITGFSGEKEYYCTEHYNEMQEILDMLIGE